MDEERRLDFCGHVYSNELLFPVTKNLFQYSEEERTCCFFCLPYCLINSHFFDHPDSRLSRPFTQVPTSPDNRGPTVHSLSIDVLFCQKIINATHQRKYKLWNKIANAVGWGVGKRTHFVLASWSAVTHGNAPVHTFYIQRQWSSSQQDNQGLSSKESK